MRVLKNVVSILGNKAVKQAQGGYEGRALGSTPGAHAIISLMEKDQAETS
jgi:ribulose 1,5-bisphosphate carboxylase large subunit-like protein